MWLLELDMLILRITENFLWTDYLRKKRISIQCTSCLHLNKLNFDSVQFSFQVEHFLFEWCTHKNMWAHARQGKTQVENGNNIQKGRKQILLSLFNYTYMWIFSSTSTNWRER